MSQKLRGSFIAQEPHSSRLQIWMTKPSWLVKPNPLGENKHSTRFSHDPREEGKLEETSGYLNTDFFLPAALTTGSSAAQHAELILSGRSEHKAKMEEGEILKLEPSPCLFPPLLS